MSIPSASQLRRGVGVRIILKADQSTGKLTTGQIDQLLTRGNHPRGIKVRLADGQIGRVQSLTGLDITAGKSLGKGQHDTAAGTEGTVGGEATERGFQRRRSRSRDRRGIQDDCRYDDVAADSRSLADYMKVPSRNKAARNNKSSGVGTEASQGMQDTLESEFPGLDSALIAAIVADHTDAAEARNVLRALG